MTVSSARAARQAAQAVPGRPMSSAARRPAADRVEPGATGGVAYKACKPLTIGDKKFKPGDVVPEAAGWTRVESWIRSGYIEQVEV